MAKVSCECAHCGKHWDTYPSLAGKYCSKKCYYAAPRSDAHKNALSMSHLGKKLSVESIAKRSAKLDKRIVVTCKQCGKEIRCRRDRPQQYCSYACTNASLEHKKKISVAMTGRIITPEHRARISESNIGMPNPGTAGKLNVNWKGGVCSENRKLRVSASWRQWREQVYDRDAYTCRICHEAGKYLHPHHVVPVASCLEVGDRNMIYNLDNGITLCKPCHLSLHGNAKGGT